MEDFQEVLGSKYESREEGKMENMELKQASKYNENESQWIK